MIEIKTPARLHLGLLDTNGNLGRLYGSIGIAINRPNVLLKAELAGTLQVEGLEVERVSDLARRFLNRYPISCGVNLYLKTAIPAHVGLGSGTQLALAVGTALARLGELALSTEEIALAMDRGIHSGVGIAAYHWGGFALDGGHLIEPTGTMASKSSLQESSVPPVLFHYPVPKSWFFVVVLPEAEAGLNGEKEKEAFLNLPRASPFRVEKISRLLLMKLLPALVEQDITRFGEALTEIQRLVGENFAGIQGGRFANPFSEEIIDFLINQGAAGAGQSSWGPTVYGLVSREDAARRLEQKVKQFLAGHGQVFITRPNNHGARLRVLAV
jgi:beta-ribofuranosylaminobenzene 5'-phosphate synthase